MPLNRLRLALVFVASCGAEAHGERVTVAPPEQSARPTPDLRDAGPPPETACFEPTPGGKPIDAQKLDAAKQVPSEPERSFQVARVYFEAEHWVEAAKMYRPIAFEHPDSDVGIYASQLYLECLNVLGTHAHRPSCYADMARDVPGLHDAYCTKRRNQNQEMCETLERIQLDLERLRASRLMEEGAAKGDRTLVHESGEQFLAMLRAHCMPSTSTAVRCDEIAYNAAIAFIAAEDDLAAKRVYAMMTDPKNKMDKSPLVPKLECRLDPAKRASCQ